MNNIWIVNLRNVTFEFNPRVTLHQSIRNSAPGYYEANIPFSILHIYLLILICVVNLVFFVMNFMNITRLHPHFQANPLKIRPNRQPEGNSYAIQKTVFVLYFFV